MSHSLLEILKVDNLNSIKLSTHSSLLIECTEEEIRSKSEVVFEAKSLGWVESNLQGSSHKELVEQVAPLLYLLDHGYKWSDILSFQAWVRGAKDLVPEVTDWIGIYYKANYFLEEETTDLILGPYYGESTTHTRIPLERGLCGLALREERVVNVADVHEDERHIACSLKTKSELIIPLKDKDGLLVAELDIDCNKLGAFDSDIEEKFKSYCRDFSNHWVKR